MSARPEDYERIAQAIDFITAQAHQQPDLEAVAARVNLSPWHFQRLFTRWAGVTPKRFLQALTVERAKQLLHDSRSVLDVSHDVGLSGPSRLHDHFVQLEAVTPGEFKRQGAGLTIQHGTHATPFGNVFIALTPRGVCQMGFLDETRSDPAARVAQAWPQATMTANARATKAVIDRIFGQAGDKPGALSLHVSGTNFQVSVWRALLQIQPAHVACYGDIAALIGQPGAARAVGRAIGANPVAFLIPCHRVIRQNGELGSYHWGTTRKRAMLAWESARASAVS